MMATCLIACGSSEPTKTEDPKPEPTPTYKITVNVNGFVGTLVLQNNGGDDLVLTDGEGTYSFSEELEDGDAYDVTVKTNPDATFCDVTNGSGDVDGEDVTTIEVHCIS